MRPQNKSPLFTSIVVTYNSENEICFLLSDLLRNTDSQPVIVIDNASQDNTVRMIEEKYPNVIVIQNKTDVGYARAVNQAFKLCKTDYFFLLNPDIRIPDIKVIDKLLNAIKSMPTIAAVAPLQFKDLAQKHYLTFTWSYYSPKAFTLFLSSSLKIKTTDQTPIPVTYLNAGCLFLNSSAFKQVGMFNEKYHLYGEEPDLFLKFKRFNYRCYLVPNTYVIHARESSMKSLSNKEYLSIKMQGSLNIIDALLNGWSNIIRDQIVSILHRWFPDSNPDYRI